jgi:hypothetical protein
MAKRARLKAFRDPDLSLWQSAVDEVVAQRKGRARTLDVGGRPVGAARPDLDDDTVNAATAAAEAVSHGNILTGAPPADLSSATLGVGDVAKFCAAMALRLARARVKGALTGDHSDEKKFQEELGTKFTQCDPRWADCVAEYVKFKLGGGKIPYRPPTGPQSFVIDGRLPPNAKIAIVGDWGTGEDAAKGVLGRIAARTPDVVFHLGDIYYSGTEHEVQTYFYAIWQSLLGIPSVPWGQKPTAAQLAARPATFTLSGNHDMYSGGAPYYTVIDMLGQPASCFCVRNATWQFIALDTGLHDARPGVETVTSLEPAEADWLKARVADAGTRKTFLLSHHQLYSAFEKFNGANLNATLYGQVQDVLAGVTAWFWGHEHDLTVYKKFPATKGVLGRCVGHGAFPVGVDEKRTADPALPFDASAALSADSDGGLFQHGYAWMELNDAARTATIQYFEYDVEGGAEKLLLTETL